MPRWVIACGGLPVTSCPSKTIWPAVGLYTPVSMLKNVVLPAPFGPIRLTIVRSGIVKSTSFTATRPPNSLRTPWAISRSATLGVISVVERLVVVLHVVEILVVDALVELEFPPLARNQALRPEQHRQHEDDPEDPRRVERHVDLLTKHEVADAVRVHPGPDVREAFLVQIREECGTDDHAPDIAHPAEDDHAEDEDGDVEVEVPGEGAALEAPVVGSGDAAEERARRIRPRL